MAGGSKAAELDKNGYSTSGSQRELRSSASRQRGQIQSNLNTAKEHAIEMVHVHVYI